VELDATDAKAVEVECHEQTLCSDYDVLRKDFSDVRASHDVVVQEKMDLEKTEREKMQQFQNFLCKKMVELQRETEESMAALRG
jgi:hypothetical protein